MITGNRRRRSNDTNGTRPNVITGGLTLFNLLIRRRPLSNTTRQRRVNRDNVTTNLTLTILVVQMVNSRPRNTTILNHSLFVLRIRLFAFTGINRNKRVIMTRHRIRHHAYHKQIRPDSRRTIHRKNSKATRPNAILVHVTRTRLTNNMVNMTRVVPNVHLNLHRPWLATQIVPMRVIVANIIHGVLPFGSLLTRHLRLVYHIQTNTDIFIQRRRIRVLRGGNVTM